MSEIDEAKHTKAAATVLLSCAITLDGYLNDMSSERLELSSPEDRDAVDGLRAVADAIVVGRGTIVADNPSLTVRSEVRQAARRLAGRPAQPVRVVLAGRHALPPGSRVLTDGAAPTIVYGAEPLTAGTAQHERCVTRSIGSVLHELRSRGMERVLIEGGERLSTAILRADAADIMRIAVAPVLVGRSRAPRIGGRFRYGKARWLPMTPTGADIMGTTSVITFVRAEDRGVRFDKRSDPEWLAEAIELGRRCPPSAGAYSVGAWIVDNEGVPVAWGYSRELDGRVHAEESAIRKTGWQEERLQGATLYTSMEPCSQRLSGRKSCCAHIIESGIRRVVFAQREPPHFVRCEGVSVLQREGIEVIEIPELAPYAAELNARFDGSDRPMR